MIDTCVFCGKETDDRLACPECRHLVEDLTPEQRMVFDKLEKDVEALKALRSAMDYIRQCIANVFEIMSKTFSGLFDPGKE